MLMIDNNSRVPRYLQIYYQIKEAILLGQYQRGYRLTNTRLLAKDLNVSRNTILSAYELLKSEGLIGAKQGGSYFVINSNSEHITRTKDTPLKKKKYTINFSDYSIPAPHYISEKWFAFLQNEISNMSSVDFEYNESFKGVTSLRNDLATLIYDYFDIKCDSEDILIGNNTEYFLDLICGVMDSRIKKIALSNKNNIRLKEFFASRNIEVTYYAELTIESLNKLKEEKIDAIYVNPNLYHEYGILMPMEERIILTDFANQNSIYIIEGNSSWEFIYQERLPSLYKLMNMKNTFFLNGFSKSLGSDYKLHFMLAPSEYRNRIDELNWFKPPQCPFLIQIILSKYIRSGKFDSAIRITKKNLVALQTLLIHELREKFGNNITFFGCDTGTSIAVSFSDSSLTNEEILAVARNHQLEVGFGDDLFMESNHLRNLIILSFGSVTETEIIKGVDILYKVLSPYLK